MIKSDIPIHVMRRRCVYCGQWRSILGGTTANRKFKCSVCKEKKSENTGT